MACISLLKVVNIFFFSTFSEWKLLQAAPPVPVALARRRGQVKVGRGGGAPDQGGEDPQRRVPIPGGLPHLPGVSGCTAGAEAQVQHLLQS